jgi:hypothetical protein
MAHDHLNPENDPFGPPAISTVVHCIHCGEEYDSYRIEWRIERDLDGQSHGFWCCPMEDCDGKGFGFDIFPVDPEYRDENGELMWCSDDEDDEDDEFEDELFKDDDFEALDDDLDGEEVVEEASEWFVREESGDEEAKSRGSLPEDDVPY